MTVLTGRIALNSLTIGFWDRFSPISSHRDLIDLELVSIPHRSANY